jgi:tetratricopeptide (TPR) repeat protein
MMLLLLAAFAQQADPPATLPTAPDAATAAGPASPAEIRYHRCFDIAQQDPAGAVDKANRWLLDGGSFMARECLGLAYANQGHWSDAAATFEAAARQAEAAKDSRAGPDWSEAGNAWLAAGSPEKAVAAFGGALASGTLDDKQAGEARLDRARAFVAKGDMAAARTDLDRALEQVPDDPLAWLLSATLARRTGDLARAHKDIAEALKRAPKAPQVQLEAGNIAAKSGDETGAKAAWQQAVALAPQSPAGLSAAHALLQFDQPPLAAGAPAQSR